MIGTIKYVGVHQSECVAQARNPFTGEEAQSQYFLTVHVGAGEPSAERWLVERYQNEVLARRLFCKEATEDQPLTLGDAPLGARVHFVEPIRKGTYPNGDEEKEEYYSQWDVVSLALLHGVEPVDNGPRIIIKYGDHPSTERGYTDLSTPLSKIERRPEDYGKSIFAEELAGIPMKAYLEAGKKNLLLAKLALLKTHD